MLLEEWAKRLYLPPPLAPSSFVSSLLWENSVKKTVRPRQIKQYPILNIHVHFAHKTRQEGTSYFYSLPPTTICIVSSRARTAAGAAAVLPLSFQAANRHDHQERETDQKLHARSFLMPRRIPHTSALLNPSQQNSPSNNNHDELGRNQGARDRRGRGSRKRQQPGQAQQLGQGTCSIDDKQPMPSFPSPSRVGVWSFCL